MKESLQEAFAKRVPHASACATLRLFDGAADGMGEIYIDRYGSVLLVHLMADEDFSPAIEGQRICAALSELAPELKLNFGVTSAYLRTHQRLAKESAAEHARHLWGQHHEEFLICEAGLTYSVKPASALHAGLYVDMRDVRATIRQIAPAKRVLNLFCYSGSLGIAAAAGGAREVCQVDSNRSALSWATRNFELNKEQCAQCEVRYINDDAIEFLAKETRRIQRGLAPCDLMIIDPPVFGRSKQGTFSLQRDLKELLTKAFAVMARNATLILTTNCREYTPATLDAAVRAVQQSAAKGAALNVEPLNPPSDDFLSTDLDSIAMRGVIVTL